MKICHVAPFGPSKCGLYEAARDMAKADILAGHRVFFIDKGFSRPTGQEYSPIGSVDNRVGFKLITADPRDIEQADIIIDHAGIPQEWLNNNKDAPIIGIVHGRPVASFRVEYYKNSKSYTFDAEVSKQDRVKKMVYFWPEFKPFWDSVFPEGKSAILEYPPIDEIRFSPDGPKHIIEDKHKGDFNILLCDSWREDVDMFEIFNGVIQAARDNKNFKLHFYAVETPIKHCWDVLFQELYKLNCMGELCARMPNMDQIYRGVDAVITPHRIVTRITGEALCCGIPIIASEGCKVSQFHCNPHDPYSVSKAITEFINSDQVQNKKNALEQSKKMYLQNYSREMNKIYNEVLNNKG